MENRWKREKIVNFSSKEVCFMGLNFSPSEKKKAIFATCSSVLSRYFPLISGTIAIDAKKGHFLPLENIFSLRPSHGSEFGSRLMNETSTLAKC
jgi:hypothetical protein